MTVPKSAKIDDVKRPDKVTPSATARPIIVSNHPTLPNDPMMAPADTQEKQSEVPAEILSHTGKTIAPLDTAYKPDTERATTAAGETSKTEEPDKPTPEPAKSTVSASLLTQKDDGDSDESGRDPDAAQTAEEAAAAEARAKRDTELESVIASGKYAVPINSVQRRRSRVNVVALCVLALVLLVALVNVVADIGLVNVPSSVPHTHLFSKS